MVKAEPWPRAIEEGTEQISTLPLEQVHAHKETALQACCTCKFASKRGPRCALSMRQIPESGTQQIFASR